MTKQTDTAPIFSREGDLTPIEVGFFKKYINAVASGGVFDPIERLSYYVAEIEASTKADHRHDFAMVWHFIRYLQNPGRVPHD